jgi:hypothetical protein
MDRENKRVSLSDYPSSDYTHPADLSDSVIAEYDLTGHKIASSVQHDLIGSASKPVLSVERLQSSYSMILSSDRHCIKRHPLAYIYGGDASTEASKDRRDYAQAKE